MGKFKLKLPDHLRKIRVPEPERPEPEKKGPHYVFEEFGKQKPRTKHSWEERTYKVFVVGRAMYRISLGIILKRDNHWGFIDRFGQCQMSHFARHTREDICQHLEAHHRQLAVDMGWMVV